MNNIFNNLKGKKVLVTGHTGFKGTYLCIMLKYFGSKVYGYSTNTKKDGIRVELLKNINKNKLVDGEKIADIRDYDELYNYIKEIKPNYIIHMAAQPLVLKSYKEPRLTYETNVLGTVNLFDAVNTLYNKCKNKKNFYIRSIVNVTTDKVYENNEKENYAFKEDEKLCGYDPYSNSKSCSELVTYSYIKSFFKDTNIAISTARAGNVIGGGDMCDNRIIPDCYRAIKSNKEVFIRNPYSTRPYQFVLSPLFAYITILLEQEKDKSLSSSYNVGPDKKSCINTKKLISYFKDKWDDEKLLLNSDNFLNEKIKNKLKIKYNEKINHNKYHEMKFLMLSNKKIKEKMNIKNVLTNEEIISLTVDIYKQIYLKNDKLYNCIIDVIEYFLEKNMR